MAPICITAKKKRYFDKILIILIMKQQFIRRHNVSIKLLKGRHAANATRIKLIKVSYKI